jgi:hypothetical protein
MEACPSTMNLYGFVLVCNHSHRFVCIFIDSCRFILLYNQKYKLLSVTKCFARISTFLICLVCFYGSIQPGDAGWAGGSVGRVGRSVGSGGRMARAGVRSGGRMNHQVSIVIAMRLKQLGWEVHVLE